MVKKLGERNWEYRFKIIGKEYRKAKFLTKGECQQAENERRNSVLHPEKTNVSFLLTDLYVDFEKRRSQKLKPSTILTRKRQLDKYFFSCFEKLDEINPKSILKWKTNLLDFHFCEDYTNQIIICVRQLLTYISRTIDIDKLVFDELDSVKLHEIKKRFDFWVYEEYEKFISTFDQNDPYKLLFKTLYFSGLRISELLALQKNDIVGNELDIYKRLENKDGTSSHFASLKTSHSNRRVLMPDDVINELKAIESDFLFPCGQTNIRRKILKHSKLANVKPIRIHDFRHSHASFLINNGASIRLVSERLGHSSPSITMDVYWHILPNEQESIIKLINDKNK